MPMEIVYWLLLLLKNIVLCHCTGTMRSHGSHGLVATTDVTSKSIIKLFIEDFLESIVDDIEPFTELKTAQALTCLETVLSCLGLRVDEIHQVIKRVIKLLHRGIRQFEGSLIQNSNGFVFTLLNRVF